MDLASVVANARTVQAVARGAGLLPMVKADGYGLGAVPVARALDRAVGPWGFGVATIDEGLELRAGGISRPVVVFTPARLDELADYRATGFRAVLGDAAALAAWDLPFHLEIDTGMARGGVRWDDHATLSRAASPYLEGAFTHFHSADVAPASVGVQWSRYQRALDVLPRRPALRHVANSPGVFRLAETLDLFRPGIFLYGCEAAPDLPRPRPVAALRARVVSQRRILTGESVSYGEEWRTPRDTTIVTVGIGYGDGVCRALQGRLQVLVRGRRYPVVGRITMDMIMVDVGIEGGDIPLGEIVTLVGQDGAMGISWEDLAGWAGTNTYEMLTGLGRRVIREYLPA